MNLNAVSWVILACASLLLVASCDTESDKLRGKERLLRVWERSETGVRYYYECIDDVKYVVTPSTHGGLQLALTKGECDNTIRVKGE